MKTFLSILVCILLLAGCCAKRPIATTVNTIDSTRVERKVVIRDTVVKLPFYKIGVAVPEKDLTEKPVSKSNGNATVELSKRGDTIYANAVCDSLELQLKLRDSIISTYRERKTDTTVTLPPVEVKYVPWYIKMLAWIGAIASLYFIVRIAYTIYKPKFI